MQDQWLYFDSPAREHIEVTRVCVCLDVLFNLYTLEPIGRLCRGFVGTGLLLLPRPPAPSLTHVPLQPVIPREVFAFSSSIAPRFAITALHYAISLSGWCMCTRIETYCHFQPKRTETLDPRRPCLSYKRYDIVHTWAPKSNIKKWGYIFLSFVHIAVWTLRFKYDKRQA